VQHQRRRHGDSPDQGMAFGDSPHIKKRIVCA
jgi:hypothetical protein